MKRMSCARRFLFLALCSFAVAYASDAEQTCSPGDDTCSLPYCKDEHEHCSFWASEGEVRSEEVCGFPIPYALSNFGTSI